MIHHDGYRRRLIENALLSMLGVETRYELGLDGVRCAIDLPLGKLPGQEVRLWRSTR